MMVLVFVWGFARLWVHPVPDLVVALGAASWPRSGSMPESTTYCISRPFLSRPLHWWGRPRQSLSGGHDMTAMSLARKASKAAVTPMGLAGASTAR